MARRNSLSSIPIQKRKNPKAVTIVDLIEIIKNENFKERYKNIKNKKRKR